MMKAADALTRRQHNETQHQLLTELTGGLSAALGAARAPKQIEAEVVEAEVVAIEEVATA